MKKVLLPRGQVAYLEGKTGHLLKYSRCANIKVKVMMIRAPHPAMMLMRIIVEAGTSNILEAAMWEY